MFAVDAQNRTNGTLSWTKGGFQGAEGADAGGSWYIENVLEELDAPREFYHDAAAHVLYYFHNASSSSRTPGATPPPAGMRFESVERQTLVDVRGTQAVPVRDLSLRGLALRDTAPTFMEKHGMPSGGDWGLHRGGALRTEGTERMVVDGISMERLDGNGISINHYNRNLTVSNSEMAWIGGSAIAAWGSTTQGLGGGGGKGGVQLPAGVGIDGTGGNQPRGTTIVGNIVREVGMWQKQSSMYFQAQACQTTLSNNVFYNGPRAHINFNDQFGGGNVLARNLLVNACRETADHGPFNSWGRQPYITVLRDGETPSITPADTQIHHNFVLGSYHTQEAIDNDDASEYFETFSNFFVYGGGGLKSDFGGHDNRHHDNVYAFVSGGCVGVTSFLPGHADAFHDNRCVMQESDRPYAGFDCGSAQASSGLALPHMGNNRVYTPSGRPADVCGMSFASWQKAGHDANTTWQAWPPAPAAGGAEEDTVVGWGRATLGLVLES